jgi:hypothetical protein
MEIYVEKKKNSAAAGPRGEKESSGVSFIFRTGDY